MHITLGLPGPAPLYLIFAIRCLFVALRSVVRALAPTGPAIAAVRTRAIGMAPIPVIAASLSGQ